MQSNYIGVYITITTTTTYTATVTGTLSGTRQRSLVRISVNSSPNKLLIKPGSIDIFNSTVIPAISRYGKFVHIVEYRI